MASASEQGLDTPQVQFVLKFLDYLSAGNLDAAFSLLSDTLVYELWPASLGHAPRTKAEYRAFLDTNPDRDVKFEIIEIVESPGKESCYIFALGMGENGSRTVLRIKEIVDSKTVTDIHRVERDRLLQQNA